MITIFNQELSGFAFDSTYGAYAFGTNPHPFTFVLGDTYTVVWDGVTYECTSQDMSAIMPNCVAVGDLTAFGGSGNGEPFVIAWMPNAAVFFSFNEEPSHTVEIQAHSNVVYSVQGVVLTDGGNDEMAVCGLVIGEEYTVAINGTEHTLIAKEVPTEDGLSIPYVGNMGLIDSIYEDTGEDFVFYDVIAANAAVIFCPTASAVDLTIAIAVSGEEDPVGIIMKNYYGENVAYYGLETVSFNTTDMGEVTFTKGIKTQKTVSADFSAGDQVVQAGECELYDRVTVEKPENLLPENIRNGVKVAGVEGNFIGDTEEATVDLDFADYSKVQTVNSEDDMGTLLADANNIGAIVKYLGEAGKYTTGRFYEIVPSHDEFDPNSCGASADQLTSGTELTSSVECNVGDLVIAAFVLRSGLVSLSDGWTLISTSANQTEINSKGTTYQTMSFAYKYATDTTEAITVTQETAGRIYLNMVSFSNANGFVDAGYQYQNNATSSDLNSTTITRPQGNIVLLASSRVYGGATVVWEMSNDSRIVQLKLGDAPRLMLAIDTSEDENITITNKGNSSLDAFVTGALVIEVAPCTVELASEIPIADNRVVSPSASGKVLSQVTIKKPVTLIPENIKKDVDIGGIIGTHEGGSGGGSIGTGKYIVTVIDYDGTILKEAKLNTGEVFTLPDVPVHDRLVFDEWASSTPIVNNAVTVENNNISIGAIYHTASGAIEVDISLNAATGKTISMNSSILTGLTSIDWGDGTVNTTLNHTYSDYGEYTIKFYGVTAIAKGTSSAGGIFVASYSAENKSVRRIFYSNSVTSIGSYAHNYCRGIISISLPKGVTTLGENALTGSFLIEGLVLPSSITDIGNYMISNFYSMKNIVIPYGFSKLFKYMLYGSSGVRHIAIPSTITSILDYAFINCYVLHSIKFPSGLTSIGGTAFSGCYSAMEYDFTDCKSVPTLGTTAFSGINAQAKILVPASLYSTWKAATNWSTYANNIVGV